MAVISQAWAGMELPVLLTHDTTLGETAIGSKFAGKAKFLLIEKLQKMLKGTAKKKKTNKQGKDKESLGDDSLGPGYPSRE